MNFIDHSNLKDRHAFLSPSGYHWINYSDEKLITTFQNFAAVERGTMLHQFAATCIKLGQNLPDTEQTLNRYVNDAIGFGLTPEQVLFYSDNCFGTADAIGYERDILRIHDLKTGSVPAHMEQLRVYAALFCLEYNKKPVDLDIQLALYQNDAVLTEKADSDEVERIMKKITKFDKLLNKIQTKGVLG